MNAEKQVCPICGASNPLEARTCAICGTRLQKQPPPAKKINGRALRDSGYYDPSMGEDDLLMARGSASGWLALIVILVGLALAVIVIWGVTQLGKTEATPTAVIVQNSPSPSLASN